KRLGSNFRSSLLIIFFFACSAAFIPGVAWISAGIDLPIVLFGIPALLFYMAARNRPAKQVFFFAMACIFFFLALKCKLMGLAILAAFACYEAVFKVETWNLLSIKRFAVSLFKFNWFFWIIAAVHVIQFRRIFGSISPTNEYDYSLSPINYLNSVGWYLNQVYGGYNLNMAIVGVIGIVAVVLAARMGNRLMIFGALWFFITLFPVGILKFHHYPHHLYFPTLGVAIYFGEACSQLLGCLWISKKKLGILLLAFFIIGYLGLGYPAFNKYTNDAINGWQLTKGTLRSLKVVVPLLPEKNVKFLIFPRPPAGLFDFKESIQITYSRFDGIEVKVFDSEKDFREDIDFTQKDVNKNTVAIPLV
ncbi:MAG: hypothetical protein ACHQVK_04310, partial [Candidatus Paceibacterales bacterium]